MRFFRQSNRSVEPAAGDDDSLQNIEARIAVLLPSHLRTLASVSSTSMGSAKLQYGPDGRVAWDQIWTHFCDLALAGGPPHRGKLLEPGPLAEFAQQKSEYENAAAEIERGVYLTTGLMPAAHDQLGWCGFHCPAPGMAYWLHKAIVAENVLARRQGEVLLTPVGPAFRIEKEVKNVVTAVAKTFHDWSDHLSVKQKLAIAALADANSERVLEPVLGEETKGAHEGLRGVSLIVQRAVAAHGLRVDEGSYRSWLGIECTDDRMAAWMIRVFAVRDILVRREQSTVFVPLHPRFLQDEKAQWIARACELGIRLWRSPPPHGTKGGQAQ
jgi:sirohydrochlorin cobaltochelatase